MWVVYYCALMQLMRVDLRLMQVCTVVDFDYLFIVLTDNFKLINIVQ